MYVFKNDTGSSMKKYDCNETHLVGLVILIEFLLDAPTDVLNSCFREANASGLKYHL
jgi:hypothetical protein